MPKTTNRPIGAEQILDVEQLCGLMQKGHNILLNGDHGVGKTIALLAATEKLNWRVGIFSCSLLDPYTDFLGIPYVHHDGENVKMKFAQAENLNQLDVLFFDDLNRGKKAIRNGVLELVQFGSIHGNKLANLKCVVAAINPDSKTYDAESLDPALLDRFRVHLNIKPEISIPYFESKGYSKEIAQAARSWWMALTPDQKFWIPPRRVEYLLSLFLDEFPLRIGIPGPAYDACGTIPIDALEKQLQQSSAYDRVLRVLKTGNKDKISEMLKSIDNQIVYHQICIGGEYHDYMDLLPEEVKKGLFADLLSCDTKIFDTKYNSIVEDILNLSWKNCIQYSPISKIPNGPYKDFLKVAPKNLATALRKSHTKDPAKCAGLAAIEVMACLLLPQIKSAAIESLPQRILDWLTQTGFGVLNFVGIHVFSTSPLFLSMMCKIFGHDKVFNGDASMNLSGVVTRLTSINIRKEVFEQYRNDANERIRTFNSVIGDPDLQFDELGAF